MLGARTLGTLSYIDDGNNGTLHLTLDNTPIGVFDGTFVGTSREVRSDQGIPIRQYLGESASSRKTRWISFLHHQGQVWDTVVSPLSERTDLSDPSLVSELVVDPVLAIKEIISANGCPETIHIYDGRRVVTLAPAGMSNEESLLTCDIDYTVTDGPRHLSPLYISQISGVLRYEISNGRQTLTQMEFQSGPFKLRIKNSS